MAGPRTPSQARSTVALRLSAAERRLLEAAAATKPQYVTSYIREAAIAAARRDLGATAGERT